ncbi:MAG: 4-hydroxy-3-methylbut-2-en-1-yl diphosphate synthase [Alphaproteobacteria bacterium CG_4_10_14_0_2_um_filter_63_37]|nr:MAG: 4-hydroxy-3-methylbut-2-en-1-yl diphosphate synthase [Proteobacteria bacterium CG1_02_64_396]PJA25253.1 MAG: 4-hydroxy-3-methylbut-2-en-1-yl diphosphate synthase [Alphaproteobacteria bacterium CG_4_10_14_0_2_um_filter_63_37]
MSHIAVTRRATRQLRVGSVAVGGDAPVSVQSMTNTPTEDPEATLAQIGRLAEAGCDIVRVSVPTFEAAQAMHTIVAGSPIPVIADIHFDHRLALAALEAGIHGLRLNPGNIGSRERIVKVVAAAADRGVSIRIGVNAGSLEKDLLDQYGEPCVEAMVASAQRHIAILEELGFKDYKVSLKASDVLLTVAAYRKLAEVTDCPLHLGITEAGGRFAGTIKSAVGLGALLIDGIGDTIRVSLADDPVEEVKVGHQILKSLGLSNRGVNIIACPTCSRQEFKVIETVQQLEARLAHLKEPVSLAVIGCVVNGPGEAKEVDIGLTGGKGENLLYRFGEPVGKVSDEALLERLIAEVEAVAASRRGQH